MHVAINTSRRVNKAGVAVEFRSALVRHTFREGGMVRHETLGNISYLPEPAMLDLKASLNGKTMVDADARMQILRNLPHGHLDAIHAMARGLRFESLLGPTCRNRDLALAPIAARICKPATLNWFADTTLGTDLGPVTTEEPYAAMDWLLEQQPRIERQLARTHLGPEHNPAALALFDLSSSWVTGTRNPLAKFGYSRDKKRGSEQIEYGMVATRSGLPIAVRVFPGNTADPAAFIQIAEEIHALSGVRDLIGDRGMITNARVEDLKKDTNLGWVTALRNTDIQQLAEDDGPLQMSLFEKRNLAEIAHPTTRENGSSPAANPPWQPRPAPGKPVAAPPPPATRTSCPSWPRGPGTPPASRAPRRPSSCSPCPRRANTRPWN